MSTGFFVASALQMFIAVNMIHPGARAGPLPARAGGPPTVCAARSRRPFSSKPALFWTEERYRLLFEQSTEPIVITTPDDLRIVGGTWSCAQVLGIAPEQARHTSLHQWFAPEPRRLRRGARPGCGSIRSVNQRLHALYRKDGTDSG